MIFGEDGSVPRNISGVFCSPFENSADGRGSDSDFRKKLQTPLFLGAKTEECPKRANLFTFAYSIFRTTVRSHFLPLLKRVRSH